MDKCLVNPYDEELKDCLFIAQNLRNTSKAFQYILSNVIGKSSRQSN